MRRIPGARSVGTAELLRLEREAKSLDFNQCLRPDAALGRIHPGGEHLIEPLQWHRAAIPALKGSKPWPAHLRCMAFILMDDGARVMSLLDARPRGLKRGRRIDDVQGAIASLGELTGVVEWLEAQDL